MASLEEDVVSQIAYDLFHVRNVLINEEMHRLTPVQLIDEAIARTTETVQKSFRLETIGACESNGDPHYCANIATHYWDCVSDGGGVPSESQVVAQA